MIVVAYAAGQGDAGERLYDRQRIDAIDVDLGRADDLVACEEIIIKRIIVRAFMLIAEDQLGLIHGLIDAFIFEAQIFARIAVIRGGTGREEIVAVVAEPSYRRTLRQLAVE